MSTLYQRGVNIYPDQEIVSVESDGSVVKATYAETDVRIRLLAGALAASADVTDREVNEHLRGRIADWWLPDEYRFVDEIPKTGTGKLDKKVVRAGYADLLLE